MILYKKIVLFEVNIFNFFKSEYVLKSFLSGLSAQSSFRKILIFILLLDFITRLGIIVRPLETIDAFLFPDDTYISLHIAKNIGSGKGPLYTYEYTNGFQPLYVFIMAPVYHLIPNDPILPVKMALFILSLFDVATLYILIMFILAITKNKLYALFSSVFWIANDYVIQTSLNGLETIMASFFILWASYYYYKIYFQNKKKKSIYWLYLGLIVGFSCFSRIDSLLFAFVLGVIIFIKEIKNIHTLLFRLLPYGIGVVFIISIWFTYSYIYTGEWYPISGKAVRYQSLAFVNHSPTLFKWYFPKLLYALLTIVWENLIMVIFLIPIFFFLLKKKKIWTLPLAALMPFLLYCGSIYLAYSLYIFGDWFYYRYLFPFAILLVLILIISLKAIVPDDLQNNLLKALSIGWVVSQIALGDMMSYYFSNPKNSGYMSVGIYARDNFPNGTIIGSAQTGALSYFADNLTVINLDGVVNKAAFQSLLDKENMDYIKKSNIEYVFGWKLNINFIKKHSKNFADSDLTLVKELKRNSDLSKWNKTWLIYKVNN